MHSSFFVHIDKITSYFVCVCVVVCGCVRVRVCVGLVSFLICFRQMIDWGKKMKWEADLFNFHDRIHQIIDWVHILFISSLPPSLCPPISLPIPSLHHSSFVHIPPPPPPPPLPPPPQVNKTGIICQSWNSKENSKVSSLWRQRQFFCILC